MKKWIALLLALAVALSLFACKSGTAGTGKKEGVYSVVNLVNGNLGDKSFFDSAESGLKGASGRGPHHLPHHRDGRDGRRPAKVARNAL